MIHILASCDVRGASGRLGFYSDTGSKELGVRKGKSAEDSAVLGYDFAHPTVKEFQKFWKARLQHFSLRVSLAVSNCWVRVLRSLPQCKLTNITISLCETSRFFFSAIP